MSTCDSASGAPPKRATARSKIFCVASAESGVFSDGFQITGSPQTMRQRRVPAPRRHRKVERGDDSAHAGRVPGFAHRVAGPFRRHRQAVELARQTDREVADVDHFLHLAETFLQDLAGLDASPARRGRASHSRNSSPNRRTSSPRRGAGTERHSLKAAPARATAAVTSVTACIGMEAMRAPSIGVCTSNDPDVASASVKPRRWSRGCWFTAHH